MPIDLPTTLQNSQQDYQNNRKQEPSNEKSHELRALQIQDWPYSKKKKKTPIEISEPKEVDTAPRGSS